MQIFREAFQKGKSRGERGKKEKGKKEKMRGKGRKKKGREKGKIKEKYKTREAIQTGSENGLKRVRTIIAGLISFPISKF